jgi:hypothetical protein
VDHEHAGSAIGEHVVHLGRRVRQAQRHGDAAGQPGRPLRDDVVAARRGEQGDPRLLEVGATVEKPCRTAAGEFDQRVVADGPLVIDEGCAASVIRGAGHDADRQGLAGRAEEGVAHGDHLEE